MITKQTIREDSLLRAALLSSNMTQVISSSMGDMTTKLRKGYKLDLPVLERTETNKINPLLKLAEPSDAEEIVGIYEELYEGTYPYKEMEDLDEVRNMIMQDNFKCILFYTPSNEIAGCVKFSLDYDNKRGYIRGFMVKKAFQGKIDVVKAFIGSMVGMYSTYRGEILVWYVENRTAHAKSQYSMCVSGVKPIAFFPNKDIFFGKVESDLMQVFYDSRALKKFRSKEKPKLIPEAYSMYKYADDRYDLGVIEVSTQPLRLSPTKLARLSREVITLFETDKFGYETITLTIPGTKSFFEFLYTPQVKNFEKVKYKVSNPEEFFVFVQQFKKIGRELNIRYGEIFVSAYNPEHQKILLDMGLVPRGYIPSWYFNDNDICFEDNILFNFFIGALSNNLELIEEGWDLLACTDLLD